MLLPVVGWAGAVVAFAVPGCDGGGEPQDAADGITDAPGETAEASDVAGDRADVEADVPPCPPLEDPAVPGDASSLTIASDFENGNGRLVAADPDAGVLTIEPVAIAEAATLWWHVRIDGLTPGRTVTLITQNDKEQGETAPVYSTDRVNWYRLPQEASPYAFAFPAASVWIARNHPYTWSRSLGLACRLARESSRVRALELTTSEGGRSVVLLRFTDPDVADAGKSMVWVQARQHAQESHGSWVAEGLARWLAGASDRIAVDLLRHAVVYVVPIMDVDNVALGGAGNGQQPIDFNQCWNTSDPWNAVGAVITRIDAERSGTPLVAFVDLHSPWYSSTNELYHRDDLLPAEVAHLQAFSDQLAAANVALGGANAWVTILHPFDHLRYPDLTGGANWYAEAHWLPEEPIGLTVPAEITHGKDPHGAFVTIQGLIDYGEALGHALAWQVSFGPP